MPTATDRFTVSIIAGTEVEDGVFQDKILGTYPTLSRAKTAAREALHSATEDCWGTMQIIEALPDTPAFTSWESLKAFIDLTDEGSIIEETF